MPKKNIQNAPYKPDAEEAEEIKEKLGKKSPKEVMVVGDNNPMALIQQAIENKVDVATMEKLMDLQERWEKNMAKKEFDRAMAAFQADCPTIQKTKVVYNKDGKTVRYKYAPLEAIVEQIKTILQKHGLSYTIDAPVEGNQVKAICKVTHERGHSQEGTFAVPIDPQGFMNEQQKFASALTFAKRYAFCNAFGILTGDEDDDASSAPDPKGTEEQFKMLQKMINEEKSVIQILTYQKKIEASDKYNELQKTALMGLTEKRITELQKVDDIPVIEEGAGTKETPY